MQHTKKIIIIFFALLLLLILYVARQQTRSSIGDSISETTPTPRSSSSVSVEQITDTTSDEEWQAHKFSEVGLTFSAPEEMAVSGELLDDRTFTLYVERSSFQNEEYYQLYGLYNLDQSYDLETVDIQGTTDGLEPTSVSEGTVSGYKSVSGQNKGERNRFVTYVFTEKGMFTLATSEPTAENKALTAEILKTMELK